MRLPAPAVARRADRRGRVGAIVLAIGALGLVASMWAPLGKGDVACGCYAATVVSSPALAALLALAACLFLSSAVRTLVGAKVRPHLMIAVPLGCLLLFTIALVAADFGDPSNDMRVEWGTFAVAAALLGCATGWVLAHDVREATGDGPVRTGRFDPGLEEVQPPW